MKPKQCPYCQNSFIPKGGQRQETCGSSSCQKALKKDNNTRWREKNPNYCRGDYPGVKAWLDLNPGYLRHYRQTHPAYVENNRCAQKLRDRQRMLHLDMQSKLKRQLPKIIERLWSLPDLDIQDEINLQRAYSDAFRTLIPIEALSALIAWRDNLGLVVTPRNNCYVGSSRLYIFANCFFKISASRGFALSSILIAPEIE